MHSVYLMAKSDLFKSLMKDEHKMFRLQLFERLDSSILWIIDYLLYKTN